jgi:hypothetical protein
MSCVCILTPVVIAAWPQFSAAVVAAATTLGYVLLDGKQKNTTEEGKQVNLEISQSEIVTDKLSRDQRITVRRGEVTVTFSRDARGKGSVCVSGKGHTDAELRLLGEELSRRVVQKYIHQRIVDEIKARQFIVVEEEIDANNAIRLKVRHWDG